MELLYLWEDQPFALIWRDEGGGTFELVSAVWDDFPSDPSITGDKILSRHVEEITSASTFSRSGNRFYFFKGFAPQKESLDNFDAVLKATKERKVEYFLLDGSELERFSDQSKLDSFFTGETLEPLKPIKQLYEELKTEFKVD